MRATYLLGRRWRWWRYRTSWYRGDDTRTFGRVFPVERSAIIDYADDMEWPGALPYYQRGRRRGFHHPPAWRVIVAYDDGMYVHDVYLWLPSPGHRRRCPRLWRHRTRTWRRGG